METASFAQSPFAALTFIAAPALLTNASSVLALSTILLLSFRTALCQPMESDGISASPGKKFRISDRALVEELLNRGAELLGDYRAFQFVRVDESLGRELALRPEAED